MKICLFTDTLGDLNGVSRFIRDMGERAFSAGIDLQILTSTSKPIPDKPFIHNLPYRFKMPMPFYQELDLVWPHKKSINAKLSELQPDLVHISTPGPFGWMAKRCAEKAGYPLVGTYHTDFPAYLHDLTGMQWVKHRTDKVMANFYEPFGHVFSRSESYLEVMASDIGINYQRASVLFPGTDLERFHPKFRDTGVWRHFGLSDNRLKVLYVGRINVEKNIPFLVDVWKRFCEKYPRIKADLVMVGEGRYRKWADRLRPHHAYFLGPLEGELLSKVYASSDLFAFPSVTDTLGQVVMEAQASGLGCLVSDIGGPQTLVIDNETGRILKAGDEDAWVEALQVALSQKPLREQWARRCRPHMEQYDIVASFKHFIEIHQRIHSVDATQT
ncbi:glycosyltransferase family 1 protein [Thiomicrorhabdus sp. ZW0627]|uniref:glycosyltransferase family 4 protein n=1 Tax=Thiomicrorhabdus sp. ZW0627 TaxID=3039774 RepID=UPI00243736B8|nr:glycosyltransferase family 1 protein [Thiomicrorhabdus sp. ZW0627]MDG6774656.1 glycosyltransferase family 1 protein [Thiomicrorhabdus sp. ZW0627]